jgi:hypothetical protein
LPPLRADLAGSNACTAVGVTARGNAPILALCRRLIEAGHDPATPMQVYRGDTLALTVRSIGEGAKFTVEERDGQRPRFGPWKPRPPIGVEPPIRFSGADGPTDGEASINASLPPIGALPTDEAESARGAAS